MAFVLRYSIQHEGEPALYFERQPQFPVMTDDLTKAWSCMAREEAAAMLGRIRSTCPFDVVELLVGKAGA